MLMKLFMGDLNEFRVNETVKAFNTTKDDYFNNFFWSDVLRRYYLHYKLTKDAKYKITIYDIIDFPQTALKEELLPALAKLQPDPDNEKALLLFRAFLEKMQAVYNDQSMTAEEYFKLSVVVPGLTIEDATGSHNDLRLDFTRFTKKLHPIDDEIDKCLNVVYGTHGLASVVMDVLNK